VDAGHDARHRRDGSHERHDAGRDAGHDAGHDSGRDSGVDAGIDAGFDAGCPAVYPGSMAIECSDFGAVCVYPEGACTCFGACGCGVPMGCAQFDVQCGSYYSPCDGVLDCGPCPPGQGCGAGGEVGRCAPTGDAGGCVPRTCADVPGQCGIVLDGCGGELDCGRCLHWGCNFPQTSCPSLEPEKGTACEPDLLTCQYTEWTMVCCMDMLECVDGEWSLVGTQCPE
jgi:hypothetical protein